jgi:hypothetical protein
MNQDPSANLSNLELDLLRSFQPSWVKDSGAQSTTTGHGSGHTSKRQEEIDYSDYDEPDDGWRKKPRKRRPEGGMDGRDREDRGGRREEFGGKHKGGKRRQEDRARPHQSTGPRPVASPVLEGWEIRFVAEPRGIEGLAKQLKATAKAHSLFELARVVLEKSPRYQVSFKKGGAGTALHQVVADGTLWPSELEAISHVLKAHIDRFYRKERIEVEPPKGVFPVVAQCGMSRVLLGPPNHHAYDLKVRKLHSERYNRIPFDDYKARIRMVRDEESIQKWISEQSVKDVFHPIVDTDGEIVPVALGGWDEVVEHFKAKHSALEVLIAPNEFTVPGPAAVNDSAPIVLDFVRSELDKLIRFPLPLAHTLGRDLATAGLQIFKAHDNITYVGLARPRPLDRQSTPVSEGIGAILDYLEANPGQSRVEQWQALLGLKPLPEGSDPSAREAEVLRDLYWLLQQGHVVDFAKKGLEIASKAPPRRKPSKEQAKNPPPDAPSAPPAVVQVETPPASEQVLEEASEQESSQVEQRPIE